MPSLSAPAVLGHPSPILSSRPGYICKTEVSSRTLACLVLNLSIRESLDVGVMSVISILEKLGQED